MGVINKFESLKETMNETTKDDKEIYQELCDKHQGMIDDRDAKCEAAKEQLIDSLKVTADKYRTATGTMEALRVMRMVNDGTPDDMQIFEEIEQARGLAADMVAEVSKLTDKAENLGWAEMDKLCEDAYDENFISKGFSAMDLCFELMRLDLCRNVGPASEDMVEFFRRANSDIADTAEKMSEMVKKHPEFSDIVPTKFQEK